MASGKVHGRGESGLRATQSAKGVVNMRGTLAQTLAGSWVDMEPEEYALLRRVLVVALSVRANWSSADYIAIADAKHACEDELLATAKLYARVDGAVADAVRSGNLDIIIARLLDHRAGATDEETDEARHYPERNAGAFGYPPRG